MRAHVVAIEDSAPQVRMWTTHPGADNAPHELMCAGPVSDDLCRGMCVAPLVGTMSNFSPSGVLGADAVVGRGAWLLDDVHEAEIDRWADQIEDAVTAGEITLEEAYEILGQRSYDG